MGVYYIPKHASGLVPEACGGDIYAQRGAGVVRSDGRALASLIEWSERQLRLHVFA